MGASKMISIPLCHTFICTCGPYIALRVSLPTCNRLENIITYAQTKDMLQSHISIQYTRTHQRQPLCVVASNDVCTLCVHKSRLKRYRIGLANGLCKFNIIECAYEIVKPLWDTNSVLAVVSPRVFVASSAICRMNEWQSGAPRLCALSPSIILPFPIVGSSGLSFFARGIADGAVRAWRFVYVFIGRISLANFYLYLTKD